MSADFAGRLLDVTAARDFTLAGNARVTVVSVATGTRFTFRVRVAKRLAEGAAAPVGPWFVSVLTGPENATDFSYFGTVFVDGGYAYNRRKATIAQDAPSVRAFEWFWKQIQAGTLPASVEVWHEGRCGRCAHDLTVPESIARGLGPKCAGLTGGEATPKRTRAATVAA